MRPAVGRVATLVVGWVVGVAVLGSLTFVVVGLAGQVVAGTPRAGADAASTVGPAGGLSGSPTGADGAPPGGAGGSGGSGTGGARGSDDGSGTGSAGDDGSGGTPAPGDDGSDGIGGDGSGATDGGTGPPATQQPGGGGTPTAPTPGTTSSGPGTGSGGPATDPTHPATPPRTPGPPPRHTASFTTEGGTAVVSCTGRTIRNDAITARDGWSFGDRVVASEGRSTVTFTHSEDGAVIEIEIACVHGKPDKTGEKTTQGKGKGKDDKVAEESSAPARGASAGAARVDPR